MSKKNKHNDENSGEETVTISKAAAWQIVSAVLLIVLIISILTGGFGFKSGVPKTTGNAAAGNAPTNAGAGSGEIDLEKLVDNDPSLGPNDAKVVVVEFSDFECPYCGAAMGTHQGLVDRFKGQDPSWEPSVPGLKKLAAEGKIRFVFRDFPLSGHPNAQKAAEASECANVQGKFWEYHDALFENQAALDIASLKKYAVDLGLDSEAFNECLDSGEMAAEVKADLAAGAAVGVRGTPAFFVNGELISGAQPFSVIEAAINAALE